MDWLGERSIVVSELRELPALAAAKFIEALPGLLDAVPCYETVGLYFSEKVPGSDQLQEALSNPILTGVPKLHRIPVCYQLGQDLEEAAKQLSITQDRLVELHSSKTYGCAAVGFVPGFAYLGKLVSELATLSRLPNPRLKVEAGSVAIVGKQTAVYPCDTPGGWWIVGKTPLVVADEESGFFPIDPGDQVLFEPIGHEEFKRLEGTRL